MGILLLIVGGQLQVRALDPTKPPGGNFNLTNFYLGLPVDSSGGTNGPSASITAAQLVAGYSNALYFYTDPDGAMVFWAPVVGATTSMSDYPRSELREQLSPPSNSSNWLAYGTHTLDAQCRVQQVPSSGKVIIGQIHGYTGAALPLVKLQYNNGTIEGLIKTNANASSQTDKKYIYSNVGLSNNITYQIKVVNELVSIAVNGVTQSFNIFQSDPAWATNTLYYKAGSYCQDNVGPTNEGARVAFYALTRSHAPSITNQPTGRSVIVGSNTTFAVSATGNGVLRYQWRFNETNNLASATNASLTLTNAQTTNAGAYSVKVTDSLGSATSVVATLTALVPPGITNQPTNQIAMAGSNALFSVVATGTEPLSYQWYFNTNTSLDAATNATLLLTNVGISNAGSYSVRVTNSAGSVTSSIASLTVNRPPVPGSYSIVTGQEIPISFPASNLLAVAFDPDGDALSLWSVNSASMNGGPVALSNDVIWFTPAAGFVGLDQCGYTLADALGALASGTFDVNIISSNSITLIPLSQRLPGDGSFSASFQGVPGLQYVVDRATDLLGPWEDGFTNLTADANGLFEFTDPNDPPGPQRFYRVHYP